MLRQTLTVAVSTALLVVGVQAVGQATRVDGTHFDRAGIDLVSQSCTDQVAAPSVVQPTIIDDDPGVGDRSLQWKIVGNGTLSGPLAHTDTPSELEAVSTQLRWIGGGVTGGLVVHFHPVDGGVWKGYQELPADTTWGWHEVSSDLTTATFVWRHFTNGVQDETANPSTLRNLVNDRGGDGDGAEVGFGFGCEAHDFVLDGLRLDYTDDHTTYDYEGFASTATLKTRDGSGRTALIAGQKLVLNARLKETVSGDAINSSVALERRAGKGPWKRIRTLKLGRDGRASVALQPTYNGAFRIRYPGAGLIDGDLSKPFSVQVHSNVKARLAHPRVMVGKQMTISGRYWMNRAAAVKLQLYKNYRWTTVKKFRSKRDGSFSVSRGAPKRPGASYWRIYVPAGGGNIDGRSTSMKLTARPKPKPQGGGTPTPTNPTPPPTTDEPPVVQPPTGPQ